MAFGQKLALGIGSCARGEKRSTILLAKAIMTEKYSVKRKENNILPCMTSASIYVHMYLGLDK